jgi:hypothetical protein
MRSCKSTYTIFALQVVLDYVSKNTRCSATCLHILGSLVRFLKQKRGHLKKEKRQENC